MSALRSLLCLLTLALPVGCGGSGTTVVRAPTIDTLRARAKAEPDNGGAQRDLALAEMFVDGGEPSAVRPQIGRALLLVADDPALRLAAAIDLDVHGQPRQAFEAYLVAVEVAAASDHPHAPQLAELALQAVAGLEGGVPGYSATLQQRLTAVVGSLPLVPRQVAGNLLTRLALRRGDSAEVRRLAAAMGCVTELRVAGPFGPRDALSFDEQHAARAGTPLQDSYDLGPGRGVRATRALGARGCRVHLGGGPLARGGTRYVQGYFELAADGPHIVSIDTPNTFEAFIDGRSIARADHRRRLGARSVYTSEQLGAGRHEFTLKVTSRHPNPVVAISINTAGDRDLASTRLPYPEASTPGLPLFVRATTALSRGDVLTARGLLFHAELAARTSPVLLSQRANVAFIDPLAPAEVRNDDARRLLTAALEKDMKLWNPAVQLAGLIANGGRVKEAIAGLRDAVKRWPDVPAIGLTLAELLRSKGWHEEADRAVEAVRQLVPEACGPLHAEQSMWARRRRQAAADALVPAIMACDARSNAHAALLRRQRRWGEADVELARLAALEPPQGQFAFWLARLEVAKARGDADAVRELIATLRSHYPASLSSTLEEVDRLLSTGDTGAALTVVQAALTAEPTAMASLRRFEPILGGEHVMTPYRRDGREAITAYEAAGAGYAQPHVLVFDYMVARVFPDGSSTEIVHTVQKAQSDEAVDALAEVQVPRGARVLKLHTIKADGTVLEPDAISGKETVSLPSMAIGDYVEFEYITNREPVDGFPGGYLGERFYFRSFEVPFHHSEMVIVLPEAMEVVEDPRGEAPAMQTRVDNGLRILRWQVGSSEPLVVEPGAVAASEFIPSVRIAVGADWPTFVESIREVLVDRDLHDPAIAQLARDIVADVPEDDPLGRAEKLYAWVLEHVENNKDVFSQAAVMLRAHTGNRARILHYLLGLVDVPAQLALVRSLASDNTKSDVPDTNTYDFLMVRAGEGSEAVWLYTVERGAPFGYVPALMRGQEALLLDAAATRVKVGTAGDGADRRSLSLDVAMQADGSATVDIVEQVRGASAVSWRGQLEAIPEVELERRFEEQYVSRLLPGARLAELSIEGGERKAGPLTFRYTVDLDVLGRQVSGGWALPSMLGSQLATNYARVPVRTTTQLVASALDTDVTLRISFPENARRPEAPRAVKLSTPGARGTFHQEARWEEGVLVIERRVRMPPHRISVKDYPAFAKFCRDVDDIEAREVVFGR